MKKVAIAIAIIIQGGCAQLQATPSRSAAAGATAGDEPRPDWLRDPARGEYPYSHQGW